MINNNTISNHSTINFMVEWKVSKKIVEYQNAIDFMSNRVDSIIDDKSPELVWFLEHPPIYTAGTSSEKHELKKANFPIYYTTRGGKFTYHGPGQLIVYFLLDLKKRAMKDVKKYVYNLEEIIIRTLKDIGVSSQRIENKIGVWVHVDDTYKKIAALGIRIKRWVTYHGFSLNINLDLSHYEGIIPCGIGEYGTTSLSQLCFNTDHKIIIKIIQKHTSNIFF